MNTDLKKLNILLGSPFDQLSHLKLALTHRSYSSENNERLEFLGDSILNFVIAKDLFQRFPDAQEGQLSRLRAKLVRRQTLAEVARDFNLGDYLVMGSGELKSGGFSRDSILSDALEAIIGAIYLNSDMACVSGTILNWFDLRLSELSLDSAHKDSKTRLQEYLQGRGVDLPEYTVLKTEGKSHNQIFYVECRSALLSKSVFGEGTTRRMAEQNAAQSALEALGVD